MYPPPEALATLPLARFPARDFSFLHVQHIKKASRWDAFFIWRSRRDLNSRAGYPTYALSRGASSPLEYYSIFMVTLVLNIDFL